MIGKKVSIPCLSNVTKKRVKQTVVKGARAGFELGKFLQGSLKAVPIIIKYDCYVLGYKPDAKSHNKMMKLRREKRIDSLVGASIEGEHMVFPHIRETFYSVEMQHNDIKPSGAASLEEFEKLSVNAIEGINMKEEDVRAMMRPMSSGVIPRNWSATYILTIF